MKSYLIDVPVFITFFVRPEKFSLVFDEIRKARPKTLFLVADGPREGFPDDFRLNEECKLIAANIDWECEVYRRYSDVNLGIDNNSYWGLKWAFQYVDRLIFLEDDILPSQSFFKFCDELLEKYLHDQRIYMISGMNHLGVYRKPSSDYFFSRAGSIWGFAIWKRSFELFEENLDYVTDEYALKLLKESCPTFYRKSFLVEAKKQRLKSLETGKISSFESLSGAAFYLNNGLILVSSKNLISCLGISENSGHSVNNKYKLPKAIRNLFFMKTYDLKLPIKHPRYILADLEYEKMLYKIMGKNIYVGFYRRVEGIIRRIIISALEKLNK